MGLDAAGLARQIQGVHAMLATALKQPLLAIELDEARMLADACIEVGKQYAVSINPRVLAWMNLAGAAVAVYGPRAFALAQISKAQAKPGAQQAVQIADAPSPGKMNFGA